MCSTPPEDPIEEGEFEEPTKAVKEHQPPVPEGEKTDE